MPETSVCPWQAGYSLNWGARKLLHPPRHILKPYLRPGMTALDVGCGMGYFTIPMAEMAGASGQVIAVDLQQEMIAGLVQCAQSAGLRERIEPRRCLKHSLALEEYAGEVDFALAFMMVHEIPDKERFVREVHDVLRGGGILLFAEPIVHVGGQAFANSLGLFESCGFRVQSRPRIAFCRSAVLVKPEGGRP